MFISCMNGNDFNNNKIHQFSLGKNYDVSTANHQGSYEVQAVGRASNDGRIEGFSFSSNGMKLFTTQSFTGAAVDLSLIHI